MSHAPDRRKPPPLDPAVVAAVLADDARERRAEQLTQEALDRSHSAIIALVAALILAVGAFALWHWLG